MAIRLTVATMGVATLAYLTSPSTASIVVGLLIGAVGYGQWLSRSKRKCGNIAADESLIR